MIYIEKNEPKQMPNNNPIEITPFAEDFKEDLYQLYSVYRSEPLHRDYFEE